MYNNNIIIIIIIKHSAQDQPLQSTVSGSGIHSPLLVHTDVLCPLSILPGGQLKFMIVPSIAGYLRPIVSTLKLL